MPDTVVEINSVDMTEIFDFDESRSINSDILRVKYSNLQRKLASMCSKAELKYFESEFKLKPVSAKAYMEMSSRLTTAHERRSLSLLALSPELSPSPLARKISIKSKRSEAASAVEAKQKPFAIANDELHGSSPIKQASRASTPGISSRSTAVELSKSNSIDRKASGNPSSNVDVTITVNGTLVNGLNRSIGQPTTILTSVSKSKSLSRPSTPGRQNSDLSTSLPIRLSLGSSTLSTPTKASLAAQVTPDRRQSTPNVSHAPLTKPRVALHVNINAPLVVDTVPRTDSKALKSPMSPVLLTSPTSLTESGSKPRISIFERQTTSTTMSSSRSVCSSDSFQKKTPSGFGSRVARNVSASGK